MAILNVLKRMCTQTKEWTAVRWASIKKFLVETVAYVFTDNPFLDSHSPYFFLKNGLKLLKEKKLEVIPNYGRAEAQSWP